MFAVAMALIPIRCPPAFWPWVPNAADWLKERGSLAMMADRERVGQRLAVEQRPRCRRDVWLTHQAFTDEEGTGATGGEPNQVGV